MVHTRARSRVLDTQDASAFTRKGTFMETTYSLGSNKHVFIDWELIEPGYGVALSAERPESWEMPYGLQLSVHNPRIDSPPLIVRDRPWESTLTNHISLFEDGGRYRMYYQSRDDIGLRGVPTSGMLAYAESDDGVEWTKPTIGTVNFDGSTDNNLVYALNVAGDRLVASPVVFKDPSAAPDQRYKLAFRGNQDGKTCLFGAVSPDGMHWESLDAPIMVDYMSDTHNILGFSEEKGRYVGYFRGWTAFQSGRLHGRRTIAYAETDTFERWPTPQTIVAPDLHDSPDTDIYTNSYTPWPGANAHLMFPAFYERRLDVRFVQMMTSRDGLRWDRPSRQPVMPAGEPGTDTEGTVSAGSGLVSVRPGEVSLPIVPREETHNQVFYPEGPPKVSHWGYVSLATWRQDGFMSLEAEAEGYCSTVPLTFEGGRLEVNAWTRFGGEIQVEVVDASRETTGRASDGVVGVPSKPIEGRTFDDSDSISGDVLKHTVTWNGESDLSAWAGKPVRLRLRMRRARLYAVQFV